MCKCWTRQIITESQNHLMLGVGRDLCGSPSPTLLPKQGHLQQAAQDLVQVGLEYLHRRRIHNLSGQPVPVLRHPQSEEVLPHVQTELPLLQFVPVAPCPVARHHWKESNISESNCCWSGCDSRRGGQRKAEEYLEMWTSSSIFSKGEW